jgi:hypothetical protein
MFSPLAAQDTPASERYASHSVLAEGRWVKIRISENGVYQLTDSLVRQAGFADAEHVRVWGYGGALQPDVFPKDYLKDNDDLKEVPTYYTQGRRLFYGVGPVTWTSANNGIRLRNFYSSYGYYFLTDAKEGEESEPLDSTAFANTFYPMPDHYHSIHEVEDFAWYHGGRQLFERQLFGVDVSHTYELPAYSDKGSVTVSMSFKRYFVAEVYVNDSLTGIISPGPEVASSVSGNLTDSYAYAGQYRWQLIVNNLKPVNKIEIKQLKGSNLRLDYLVINSNLPRPMWNLSDNTLPEPQVVGLVAPQDRHADPQADLVIVIPASRKMQEQAERLKKLHEDADSLRVNLVTADELYNEFSSGTPDGNAYRRYLKMLYDRAEQPSDRPRFLLLFGDGAFDNRMLLSDWSATSPDDYLLCYESENSFSETKCYVTDDYFGLLDDGDGGSILKGNLIDVAVGRFPVTTADDAKVMVDKIVAYYENADAGPWQNLLCFMGDDGNQNMHMNDAEVVIQEVEKNYTGFQIQKIYWDVYRRSTTITGDRYPDVERLVKQNMQDGALVMNYTGHGGARSLSHEYVISLTDFQTIPSTRLPLWVTASCDIMPYDGREKTLGEVAVLAPNGGAIAFYGTARTVYAYYNQYMNKRFMRQLLGSTNGRRNSIGEAARLAKNELNSSGDDVTENKYQYVLLGDPALVLAAPTLQVSIDSIGGQPANGDTLKLAAGSRVMVTGHIVGDEHFNGTMSAIVYDAEQTITGRRNNRGDADTAIVFKDYPTIIYTGNHRVNDGKFRFTFTVSRNISYADAPAKILIYAVNDEHRVSAHGENRNFYLVSGENIDVDEEGPLMLCYLNNADFKDGDEVEQCSMFVAELYDEDGINSSGSGIGHDLELVIDNKIAYTYYLNNYFECFDGDNRQGTVRFQLPTLSNGTHRLRFRAWDIQNNSSKVTFSFSINDPMGIDTIETDDAEDGQEEVFDMTGRKINSTSSANGRLYIYRMPDGSVKKMVRTRQ